MNGSQKYLNALLVAMTRCCLSLVNSLHLDGGLELSGSLVPGAAGSQLGEKKKKKHAAR